MLNCLPVAAGAPQALPSMQAASHKCKEAANLFGVLALDHGGDLGAGQVQQALDVQVVGRQDQLEEDLALIITVFRVSGRPIVL